MSCIPYYRGLRRNRNVGGCDVRVSSPCCRRACYRRREKGKTDGTHKRFQTSALRTNPLCHIYVYRRFVAEKNGRIAKNRRRFRRGGRKVRHIDLRRVVDARRKLYQQYSDERFVLGNHRNRVAFCGVCVGNRQQHRRVPDARRRACGNNVHGAFEKP